MSKDKLIPTLRFHEFKNAGEWQEKTLGDISKVVSKRNKANRKFPIYSINNKEGFLPQNEQFEGVNSSDRGYDISLYKIIESNTFAYNPARIDVGSIGFSGELNNIIISSLYVCFQTTRDIDDKFLWYYFSTFQFTQSVKNNVEGGIRNYLFYKNFSKIGIAVPKIKEQQKIASCLSSLDEVIAAHLQKLELLKDHKKGLMQNLFPQEDETVPKYRFSEFENDGEWLEKKLGEVCEMQAGKFISASEINDQTNNDFFPCYGGNGLRGYTNSFTHSGTYSLIGRQGALCGNVTLVEGHFHATEHAVVVTPETNIDTIWLYYVLELLNLNQYATGQAQPGLSVSNLEQVELYLPINPKEQQKIASCLSSLDALITAQAEKIEQLQLHKKGLMQGLFPKSITN